MLTSLFRKLFNKKIGKSITFKYQCPSIIEKNTVAVIAEFSSDIKSAPSEFRLGIRFGNINLNDIKPIKLIMDIIKLLACFEFQYIAVNDINITNQIIKYISENKFVDKE